MARKGRRSAGSQFQQRLRGLVWQMVGKIEEAVVVCAAHIGQPLGRYTVVQQFFIGNVGKGEWSGLLYLHVDRDLDLLDRLAHFDQLGRAGPGVGLQPALPRPAVGGIVVIDVAEQEAILCAVNDDADVRADAHGPEIFITGAVEPVELQARARGIDLHIKGGRLDRFLFVTAQSSKTIGEGVGNAEFHRGSGQWLVVGGYGRCQGTRKIFITSSPRWFMTLTAMRPEAVFRMGARCRCAATPRLRRRSGP